MQFESLKLFCDVARHRSFSQAAQANRVSQSAVSQVVLQLEKRLGVKLIDRSTRPLQLTGEGKLYYDGCRGLVEQYMEVEAAVRKAQTPLGPTVQVAAIYSVGLGNMSQYVERFAVEHPDVEVHIEYLHPDRVYERVRNGTADFGLVSFPRKDRDLTAVAWREEEMVLACWPGHPLAPHRSVRPAQLAGEKYVGFDRDLVIRRKVDRFLRDHGVEVEIVLEFDNIENIKKAIEISAGLALLPRPTLEPEIRSGTLAAVPLAEASRLVRPLGIIRRRNQKVSGTASRFMELLLQADEPPPRGSASGVFASGTRPRAWHNGSARGPNGAARHP